MQPIGMNVYGQTIPPLRQVKFVGTAGETLKAGEFVCFDYDNSTVSNREYVVETPTIANIQYPAGVIADISAGQADANGEKFISIVPYNQLKDFPSVELYTDASVTIGDILCAQPGTRTLRRGALFGYIVGKAMETQDRSTTAGTVKVSFNPSVNALARAALQHEWYDDFHNYVTVHEGLTSSLGASATAAAANSVLTLTTTNVDDIQAITASTVAIVAPATNKPVYLEGKITPTEAGTNAGNFFFGLHDGTISATIPVSASNALTNSSESYAIFAKLASETVWSFHTNDDGATDTSTATAVVTGSAVAKKFGVLWDGKASYLAFIDDVLVATHTTDLPTGKNLKFVVGALASTTEVEIVAIDYWRFVSVK